MAKVSINMQEASVKDPNDQGEIIVGIDLGTTNSLIAYMNNGMPTIIKDPCDRTTLVPSIIHFDNTRIQVGNEARKKLETDPENTIFSVKRLMGKSFGDIKDFTAVLGYQIINDDTDRLVKIRVGDTFYSPIELSAFILSELKERAETVLERPISKAVITVPAYFNDTQRQATRDAGKLAGLDVLRIINEPTAAALIYGLGTKDHPAQKVAIYDLGGGTFDISILSIEDGIFEVLSTNGDTFLGGDDIDKLIIDHWIHQDIISKSDLDNKVFGQFIRLLAEKAKKELSDNERFEAELEVNDQVLVFALARDEFRKLISGFVERTILHCNIALKDAGLSVDTIDAVVMVGGSTRIPAIQEAVQSFFRKDDLHNKINPDETVALGAAIQADILAGNNKEMLLLDITPLSLGIETVGGLMDVILPRNSKVPVKVGRDYTTSVDGQTQLKVAVYQGERDLVQDNRKLGEFILKGVPPMPAGLPKIEIGFMLDADGVLQVSAKEKRSGVAQTVEIRSQYGLSEEEMGRMLIDSVRHAKDDMKTKALLEAKNEGRYILDATEKFIRQNESFLSENDIHTLRQHHALLQQAVQSTDKDLINQRIEEINTFSSPLAQIAMDKVVAEAMKGKSVE